MANKKLIQNPQRYSKDGSVWKISASDRIQPLTLPVGVEVGDLKPIIAADGIIVKLINETGDLFLISPQTLQDIKDSNHPHYTSGDSGRVKGAQIGKSIPVITLNIGGLTGLANQQDIANNKAGVKDAQYIFEGEELNGIPKLLLEQINYTLTKDGVRPADSYDLWNIQLRGNYSIDKLVIETTQDGSKVNLDKLDKLMRGVDSRLQYLREDFNTIKDVFYNGKIPEPNLGWSTITKLAKSPTELDEDLNKVEHQVVFKYSETVELQPSDNVVASTTNVPVGQVGNTNTTPPSATDIRRWQYTRKRNLISETWPVIKAADNGAVVSNLSEGDSFWGVYAQQRSEVSFSHRGRSWRVGDELIAVYDENKTTIIGYVPVGDRIVQIN